MENPSSVSNRLLPQRLMEAVTGLLSCGVPGSVMGAALEGAIRAGARGGFIVRVNRAADRILGVSGAARESPDSSTRWVDILDAIDLPAPSRHLSAALPLELSNCSRPVLTDVRRGEVDSDLQFENVLQICARTRHAIHLTSSMMPWLYRQLPHVTEVGSSQPLMVMPLIGLDLDVIGVLGLGFQQGVSLDNEAFHYWIGYAQKVGTALERADEAVQRRSLVGLSQLGTALASRVSVGDESRDGPDDHLLWFGQQLEALLEVEDVRVVLSRPPLGADADQVALNSSPAFLNRCILCDQLTADSSVPSHEGNGNPVRRSDPMLPLGNFGSVGIIPLHVDGEIGGTLCICAKQEYFFTTHAQELAMAAAREAEQLLLAFKTRTRRYQSDRIHKLSKSLEDSLLAASQINGSWEGVFDVLSEGLHAEVVTIIYRDALCDNMSETLSATAIRE